jgi:hypothetical protein
MSSSLWYHKHRPRVPERVCPADQTQDRKQSSFTDAKLSFDPRTGTFLGQLKNRSGTPLTISAR